MTNEHLKERIVGAAVLVFLAVIFIPMFLSDEPPPGESMITKTNIPEKPKTDFSSRIIPLEFAEEVQDTLKQPVMYQTETAQQPSGPIKTEISTPEAKASTPEAKASTPEAKASTPEAKASTPEAKASTLEPKETIEPTEVGVNAWIVQLGSFTLEQNAQSLNAQLRAKKYPAFVEPLMKNNKVIYRVRVGPELRREDAEKIRSVLKKNMDLDGIIVRYP